jgi:AcrR family transcriptional regulator
MTSIMKPTTDRKAQTHERILEVAARAVRRHGYDGVGVAEVMKEAGLTHGGFYAHFPSRDAMLAEAVQRAGRDADGVIAESSAAREAAGESPFAALVNTYLHDAHLTGTETGCVVAALASEMPRQDAAALAGARARVQNLIGLVRTALPEGVAVEEAPAIAGALVGSLQLARTLGGKAGKALLAQSRRSLLSRYAPS